MYKILDGINILIDMEISCALTVKDLTCVHQVHSKSYTNDEIMILCIEIFKNYGVKNCEAYRMHIMVIFVL